jgi:hypothetical protein
MTKSDNTEDAVLALILAGITNNYFGSSNIATPGSAVNLFLSLHTAGLGESPSNGQNQNETSYSPYLRLTIARNTANWSNLSAGLYANGNTSNFTFAQVGTGTPTITHWAIGTTSNDSGEVIYSGPLSDSDPQPFTVNDSAAADVLQVIDHGHLTNEELVLLALPNVTFPTGVASNLLVYAMTVSNDGLQVKATAGGNSALAIVSGAGLIAGMTSQTIAENNTPRFVALTLRITED